MLAATYMRTITENFNIILARQKLIGYDYHSILNPPASIDEIARVEKRLDLGFSTELLELYMFANGTKKCSDNFGAVGLVPHYIFSDLAIAEIFYSNHQSDFELTDIDDAGHFTMYDDSYTRTFTPQRKLFPIFFDGSGDYYWVDLNENTENYNKVYWTNSGLACSPFYEFNSLTSMFQTIAESYENNVFSFESDIASPTNYRPLIIDYKQWVLIGKRNNPGLNNWDE